MEIQRKGVAASSSIAVAAPDPTVPDDGAMSFEQLATSTPGDTISKSSSSSSSAPSAVVGGVSREGIEGAARGDAGPGVSSLQEQLNALHVEPSLRVDGDFGPRTEAALKQYQAAHRLPVTGVVDDATRAAIDEGMRNGSSALPEPRRAPRGGLSTGQPRLRDSVGGVPVLDQSKLPKTRLGESKTATLSGQGCVLTSLAMVASKLKGEPQDPVALNDTLRDAGAFVDGTGMLNVGTAAGALGLEAHAVAIGDPGALSGLDGALRRGEPVMVRVDYKGGPGGDHTVVLTHRNPDGSYGGIDPAGGRAVLMRPDAHGNLIGDGWRHYTATGLTFVATPDDDDIL